jgi:hypothetical protein
MNKAEDTALGLLEVAKQTLIDRGTQRDCKETGERSMAATVKTFNALTGQTLTEANGWEFMVLLKMVRGRQGVVRALLGECILKQN